MVRSMTGFGVGEAALGAGRVVVEARSVNHRFLDVRARTPRELGEHGTFLEQRARARLARGRVEIVVRFEGPASGALMLDKKRAAEVYRAFDELRAELRIEGAVPLALLGSIPELFISPMESDPEGVRSALAIGLERALDGLDAMRQAEGEHLQRDLEQRLAAVTSHAAEVAGRAPELPERYRRKLRDRIARLMEGQEATLDPGRLEQEVALFADHADISEELTRLASHARQFAALLAASEPVGRRLDFLLQEMAREVNTIGSKSNEAEIVLHVVELKAEIEKMREQVQNVE